MTVVFSYLALATLVATYTLRTKLIAVDGWSCVNSIGFISATYQACTRAYIYYG